MSQPEHEPDISIPQGNPSALKNLLRREWADRKAAIMDYLTPDSLQEIGQCNANVDNLLDHFPTGVHRDLGRQAVKALDERRVT